MKQVILFTVFGLLGCSAVGSPLRTYPTSQYSRPTQYQTPLTYPINQNPLPSPQQIPILRSDSSNNGQGAYAYSYKTANGIDVGEEGRASDEGTRAQGGFSYTAPNGQPIQLQYSADEYGFIPQGNHLPVALTGPLLRSIQSNIAEERLGIVDDGQYRAGQQQYTAPQNYGIQQQYSTSTRYNTPQKNSPSQQYRVPQSNVYGGYAFPRRS